MLKLASNHTLYTGSIALVCLWSLFFLFSACQNTHDSEAERLNNLSYAYHYRSLDSLRTCSERVLAMNCSADMHSEALNNLALYHIGKMEYDVADSILCHVIETTDNNIELAIANIQQMKLCQRESRNKDFYSFRQKAINHLKRLKEESNYTDRQRKRIVYAEAELRLITSVYDYYVGRIQESIDQLHEMDSIIVMQKDTAQTLAYLYNIGAGGILSGSSKEYVSHMEYDYLLQCYTVAEENGYKYWQANTMQAIAEHILADKGKYIKENPLFASYLNTERVPDSLLAGNIALRALMLFEEYGDIYQQAATWRTLSQCYASLNDYGGALYALDKAVHVSRRLSQSPALMASIYELYSIAFSALDKKQESDYYRNKYLDLYDDTRQDRKLEARAEELSQKISYLNVLIYSILAIIFLLSILLLYLVTSREKRKKSGKTVLSSSMQKICEENEGVMLQLDEDIELLEENNAMMQLQLERQQEFFLEQRAKAHLILTITPLLDRMLHEVKMLITKKETADVEERRKEYIHELLQKINNENAFLTQWIQMKQGELSLRIESFDLQKLFDVVRKNATAFEVKGIDFIVEDTPLVVKADSILTLFMINTICDNARKHTDKGCSVRVYAYKTEEEMVEISIADTGSGMSAVQREHLFDVNMISDEVLDASKSGTMSQSHRFGLPNCKGIIEKYKKTNALFRNCTIGVESEEGKGTRVFFRLPEGVKKAMLSIIVMLSTISMYGGEKTPSALADSVYNCNVQGRYADAISYAQECMQVINHEYRKHSHKQLTPADTLLLCDSMTVDAAEVRWFHANVSAPYTIILALRNETAVAALALHNWELYHYNNNVYSQLFKDFSADNSIGEYCRKMEKTENDSNVAAILLFFLILSFIPIYYFAYYKHVVGDALDMIKKMRKEIRVREEKKESLEEKLAKITFEHDRLHVANNIITNSLSTIKHETMYYPSRILHLLNENDIKQINEVAGYYRIIYHTLSEQAQYNSANILPPKVITDILLRFTAKISGMRKKDISFKPQSPYTVASVTMKGKTKEPKDVLLRIITQATRDLGEIYGLRRCGTNVCGDSLEITVPEDIFSSKSKKYPYLQE